MYVHENGCTCRHICIGTSIYNTSKGGLKESIYVYVYVYVYVKGYLCVYIYVYVHVSIIYGKGFRQAGRCGKGGEDP